MNLMLKRVIQISIWALIIIGLFLSGYLYWHYQNVHPSTEDAYVNANIIQIAAQVNGQITSVDVEDHAFVKKRQLLFTIDPKQYLFAEQQANANLVNVRQQVHAAEQAVAAAKSLVKERAAELFVTRKDTDRILTLVRKGLYPIAKGDEATSQLKVAEAAYQAAISQLRETQQQLGTPGENNARIKAAKAALATAKLNLSHTNVYAPASGQIINLTLREGSVVTAETPLFALIENNRWWVDANFKETDLQRLKNGQKARIKVDMYPDYEFQGTVVNISGGSGAAFSLLPPEDATGNWIKVIQRFPVKIKITNLNPKYPLRVGASSKVIVDTAK